jgi:hypothetical protein
MRRMPGRGIPRENVAEGNTIGCYYDRRYYREGQAMAHKPRKASPQLRGGVPTTLQLDPYAKALLREMATPRTMGQFVSGLIVTEARVRGKGLKQQDRQSRKRP